MTDQLAYQARVRIERQTNGLRKAYLPAEPEPTLFGMHSEIAAHYGADLTQIEPHAATIDYFVAAIGG